MKHLKKALLNTLYFALTYIVVFVLIYGLLTLINQKFSNLVFNFFQFL